MKNAKTILAIIIVLLAALLITLGLGIRIGRASVEPQEPTIVRDTIRKTDTVRMPAPPPDTVTKTITKVKKVPLYIATADTVVDSVLVQLPFEQHFAHLDSVADLWYSGYEAKIDSAIIYKRSQTIVENTLNIACFNMCAQHLGLSGDRCCQHQGSKHECLND